ncbi:mycothione reductase [Catenulispora pinisilvae]|uniref:mycothione reductase n=1 Tax=Catenulispora pinisilvae TaxID=2705253 RepID=UPI0018918CCF|nr:mycothione reductase [Catenulispora pinisilvae]
MRHFDLIVIGSGSGDAVISGRPRDWKAALVDDAAVGFGGTCLNVGCIPSKMFVYTADLAEAAGGAGAFGLDLPTPAVRWQDIRKWVFDRIDRHSADGLHHRRTGGPSLTLFEGRARFTGPKTLLVADGETISADRFVIAAGSRPIVPDVPGLTDAGFLTNETVMRIDKLPERLVILGAGAIAAEFAHVFSALGVHITVIARSGGMLTREDGDVSRLFTDIARRKWDLREQREATRVERDGAVVRVHLTGPSGAEVVEGDELLVAVGRRSNADRLDLSATGVATHPDGRIAVDRRQRTNVPGIFALGDVSSRYQLKHVANHEARVVAHNLVHPDQPIEADHRFVPHAVFTAPQIASVGLTEQGARAGGVPYVVGRRDYAGIAYGWAMNDPEGFAKILADPQTGRLLGAHIIGPQASALIQPLIQAMSLGQDAATVARGQYWIHPAMSELVENALLDLPPRTG